MTKATNFTGFGGVRLHAEVAGSEDNPAVLLVHGGGQSHHVWADVAAALVTAGRQVVSLDLRGHGASQWADDGRYDFGAFAEDLRAVLAQMNRRPVIVATTLGGWITTAALARDAANLASGLVLVDLPIDVSRERIGRASDVLRGALRSDLTPAWDERWLDALDVSTVSATLAAAAPNIKVPTLIVQGDRSDLATHDQTAAFVALLPDAEFAEVPAAGQLVAEQRLDAFNALLLDFLERRQPRSGIQYRSGSDARTLRDAMSCFATGVTIVTARDSAGEPIGLTANSFTSLSLDPPLLLVCIANSCSNASSFRTGSRFAVNVLQIGQQPASDQFAGRSGTRFASVPWQDGETGSPVVSGSLVSFECERFAVHEGGDHFILVGRVVNAIFEPRRDPLLFFRGRYRRLHFA